MESAVSEPAPIRPAPPAGAPGPGNGGNGEVTRHRLDDLERRMGTVEEKVDEIRTTVTRIDTKLDAMKDIMADKGYVLRWFGLTVAVLAVSLVGHLFILTISD